MGLSFSVRPGWHCPKSLINISASTGMTSVAAPTSGGDGQASRVCVCNRVLTSVRVRRLIVGAAGRGCAVVGDASGSPTRTAHELPLVACVEVRMRSRSTPRLGETPISRRARFPVVGVSRFLRIRSPVSRAGAHCWMSRGARRRLVARSAARWQAVAGSARHFQRGLASVTGPEGSAASQCHTETPSEPAIGLEPMTTVYKTALPAELSRRRANCATGWGSAGGVIRTTTRDA